MPASRSMNDLAVRLCKRAPRVVPVANIEILEVDGFPRAGLTTLMTSGLAAHERSRYRGRPTAFELVATTARAVEVLRDRLAAAVCDDLAAHARGDAHLRVQRLPPRGILYNGVFEAARAPHLLFATDLALVPAFAGRHVVGNRSVELLPAIPITDAELNAYDADPAGFIARLRTAGDLAQRL